MKVNRIMEFLVRTYFSQFEFVGSSIYIMEVAKVNKLSLELKFLEMDSWKWMVTGGHVYDIYLIF